MRFDRPALAAAAVLAAVTAGGCASTDSALFVTKTSIGIELDAKPANVNIAYDRIEGYLGPRYDNGAIPPVVASINSDGAVFNPKVRQIYATGDAALNVVTEKTAADDARPLSGGKKLMFFGTTTTTGFKVGFTSNVPDSVLFGFKRKEFSFIPLGTHEGVDVYPAVLAAIDTTAGTSTVQETGLVTRQFFATGSAAEVLGTKDYIRQDFRNEAQNAFAAYREQIGVQQGQALVALRCFAYVPDERLPAVWADAQRHGLFQAADRYAGMKSRYDAAVARASGDPVRAREVRELRGLYADDIGILVGAQPTRAALVQAHRKFVCTQAQP